MEPSESEKSCIIVLGMHRSGTSALTRVLNLLGVELGTNFVPPDWDNPKGFIYTALIENYDLDRDDEAWAEWGRKQAHYE